MHFGSHENLICWWGQAVLGGKEASHFAALKDNGDSAAIAADFKPAASVWTFKCRVSFETVNVRLFLALGIEQCHP